MTINNTTTKKNLNDLVEYAIVKYDNENSYIKENDIDPVEWKEWKNQGYSDEGFIQIMDCYYLAGNATTGTMSTIDNIDDIIDLLIDEMDASFFDDTIEMLNDDCENPTDKININNTYECLETFIDYCNEIAIFKQTEGKYKDHYCLVIDED